MMITDLGPTTCVGGGDDTVLFSKDYSTGNTAWAFYTSAGEAPISALGNATRFSYQAISTANGSPSVGGLPTPPTSASACRRCRNRRRSALIALGLGNGAAPQARLNTRRSAGGLTPRPWQFARGRFTSVGCAAPPATAHPPRTTRRGDADAGSRASHRPSVSRRRRHRRPSEAQTAAPASAPPTRRQPGRTTRRARSHGRATMRSTRRRRLANRVWKISPPCGRQQQRRRDCRPAAWISALIPRSRNDVRRRTGRQQLAVGVEEAHPRRRDARTQAQDLGFHAEGFADTGAQVVDAQVDGAELEKRRRRWKGGSSRWRAPIAAITADRPWRRGRRRSRRRGCGYARNARRARGASRCGHARARRRCRRSAGRAAR